MLRNISFVLLIFFLAGCASWDSKKFEPSQDELNAAAKINILQKTDAVDTKKCQIIGDLKLHPFSQGQPANVVAVRKYRNASLVKFIGSGMVGSVLGEGPADFYDVYRCDK